MSDEPRIGVPSPRNEQRLMGELCAWIDRPPVLDTSMTDSEWAECADPRDILSAMSGRLSNRVLRLFAAACVRRVWHLLLDERGRRAVEAAEQFAAGLIGDADLASAKAAITSVPAPEASTPGAHGAFCGAWYTSGPNPWNAAWFGSRHAAEAVGEVACAGIIWQQAEDIREACKQAKPTRDGARDLELAVQASLLRAIVEVNSLRA